MISDELLNQTPKQSTQQSTQQLNASRFPLLLEKTFDSNSASPSTLKATIDTDYGMGSFAGSMAKYAGMFSNGAFSNSFSMGVDTSCKPPPRNNENVNVSTKKSKDDLLTGLFKIFIAVLKIPTKFDLIFNGIKSAGTSLALGIEGAIKSTFLGIEDIVLLVIALFTFTMKYITCIFGFFINLPYCFLSHIITCISSVLYLIFPFTSFLFWMGTGIELMPYYEIMFSYIDAFDDQFAEIAGFHFAKFPRSIIKMCYTCNNKVIRLRDIIKDAMKITKVGNKINKDANQTIPRFMKPAMPHIYKTAYYVNKVFS
jgi:hypothetical protein